MPCYPELHDQCKVPEDCHLLRREGSDVQGRPAEIRLIISHCPPFSRSAGTSRSAAAWRRWVVTSYAVSSMTADRILVDGEAKHATSLRISNTPWLNLEPLSRNNNTAPENLDDAPEIHHLALCSQSSTRTWVLAPIAFFRVIEV